MGTNLASENLHNFLLLTKLDEGYFWIDQLCIDQAAVTERNAEVKRMEFIYERASSVRLWLGASDQHTETAFKALRDFVAHEQSLSQFQLPSEERKHMAMLVLNNNQDYLTALTHLFGRPYWTRIWVVQEIWFARDLRIQCGPFKLGVADPFHQLDVLYNGLSNAIEAWMDASEHTDFRGQRLFSRTFIRHLTDIKLPLRTILLRFRGECADPRDKVYALQSLVEDDYKVAIDYSLSALAVFWKTVDTAYSYNSSGYAELARILTVLGESAVEMGISEHASSYDIAARARNAFSIQGFKWPVDFDAIDAETSY